MTLKTPWSRAELLVAYSLYCELPFGQLHQRNKRIARIAGQLGRTPSSWAMKLSNIASLAPVITATGRRGLSGASTADRAMWEETQADWGRFAVKAQEAMDGLGTDAAQSVTGSEVPEQDTDFTGMERPVQAVARVGQDFFRRSVLSAYNQQCCITGPGETRLLVAIHIVPWRADGRNRRNPRNGLCLSSLHDSAFDAGIITMGEDVTVRVFHRYKAKADPFFAALLAYEGKRIAMPEKFRPRADFLDDHRRRVFEG